MQTNMMVELNSKKLYFNQYILYFEGKKLPFLLNNICINTNGLLTQLGLRDSPLDKFWLNLSHADSYGYLPDKVIMKKDHMALNTARYYINF